MQTWQPSTTIETLHQRATIIQQIRDFFQKRGLLEVETPCLAAHAVTDPYIQSIPATVTTSEGEVSYFLQTSPEYHMKRLLAAGSGDIFQITKCFRNEESGRWHNPEFTMLEWYRIGFDDQQLMDEIEELLVLILQCSKANRLTYQAAFSQYVGIDPLNTTVAELQQQFVQHQLEDLQLDDDSDAYLQILFERLIEPHLQSLTFIYDFPASQSSLARLKQPEETVAARFEVYYQGVELANGFHELTDVAQQRQRFEHNQSLRQQKHLPYRAIDEKFLAALTHGLPNCAGVAAGVDRLIMLALQQTPIDHVISFTINNS